MCCTVTWEYRTDREITEFFSRSYVIIVENDSTDGTKEILESWQEKSHNVQVISNDYGTKTIPNKKGSVVPSMSFSRIEKMVFYRNMYLDILESINDSIDYLMVIDIDINSFSIEGILKSIQNAPNNFGGIFANGRAKVFGETFLLQLVIMIVMHLFLWVRMLLCYQIILY